MSPQCGFGGLDHLVIPEQDQWRKFERHHGGRDGSVGHLRCARTYRRGLLPQAGRPAFAAFLLGCASLSSGSAAETFEGRTVTILVSGTPGGGYDAFARLLARHLGRHLPGTPAGGGQEVPGAGGLALQTAFYNSGAARTAHRSDIWSGCGCVCATSQQHETGVRSHQVRMDRQLGQIRPDCAGVAHDVVPLL